MRVVFVLKDGTKKQFQLSINQVQLVTTSDNASSGVLEIHNIQKKMFEFLVLKEELTLDKLNGIMVMNDARDVQDAIEMILPVDVCTDYQASASITGNYIKYYFEIKDNDVYLQACNNLINNK